MALIDSHLDGIDRSAAVSEDPDAYGILDQLESIAGLGFAVCQTYMTAHISRSRASKPAALALGPRHRTGRTFAEVVNAAANFWKHSAEWDRTRQDRPAAETVVSIQSLGIDTRDSYPLGNVLYELLRPHPSRFAGLVPFLLHWRDDLTP